MKAGPIGIFDSGIGGLTVARHIFKQLPRESVVYFGDTARVPYGNKSPQTVTRFAEGIIHFLLTRRVKIVIIACNTTSAFSLNFLKKRFPLPIIGVIEAGVARALERTRNKKIGVIGTEGTIRSKAYPRLIKKSNPHVKVFSQACPLFVPLAEEGWVNKPVTEQIAREYLSPLVKRNIDTLILGCTHYPLLKPTIKKVIGKGINLVDSGEAVAEIVKNTLGQENLPSPERTVAQPKFFVTDAPDKFIKVGQKFLGQKIKRVKKIIL